MMELWCIFKAFVEVPQVKRVTVLFEEIKLCKKLKMIPIVG